MIIAHFRLILYSIKVEVKQTHRININMSSCQKWFWHIVLKNNVKSIIKTVVLIIPKHQLSIRCRFIQIRGES